MLRRVGISRRRFLGGALATTAGLALAGCGGGGDEEGKKTAQPTGAAGGEPKRGGTLRYSVPGPFLSLDPQTPQGVTAAPYFYSYVVHDTDWEGAVGDLAESWEVPDQLSWIFKIRSDVRFQDVAPANGRALDARDIIKSLDRGRALPGAPDWSDWLDHYEAPDPNTFEIVSTKPFFAVLGGLGSPITAIVPVEAAEQFGDLKSQVVGSGPFMMSKYDANNELQMVRNPTYYHEFPYVDGQNVKVLADDALAQAAFRAGQLDVYNAATKPKADSVSDVKGASTQKYLSRVYLTLVLNGMKIEAFKDERVREAVDLALDRKQMIAKICFGDGELAGPIPPSGGKLALPKEEIEAAYQRDVAKAKSLLSAAGAEGLHFTLDFSSSPEHADLASIVKGNLAQAGITADLAAQEAGTWTSHFFGGDFQASLFQQLPYLGADFSLQFHHSHGYSRSDAFYYGVDDPEVDGLLEDAMGVLDEQKRIDMWWSAQRLILKRHGPMLTLYQPYGYWVAMDFIKGYTPTAYGFGLYKYDYWIDKG
jgi:peptide/nickel transport system substrate-binding protein